MTPRKDEPTKTTSLRLDEVLHAELVAVARADGQTVSDVVREAIEKHITNRSGDPDFQERLKEDLNREVETAKRLAERLDE